MHEILSPIVGGRAVRIPIAFIFFISSQPTEYQPPCGAFAPFPVLISLYFPFFGHLQLLGQWHSPPPVGSIGLAPPFLAESSS